MANNSGTVSGLASFLRLHIIPEQKQLLGYIQAGMEVMLHLSGSPAGQQIPEYTTQAKVGVLCTLQA